MDQTAVVQQYEDTETDPITLADVAGAVGTLGNTFTAMEVYAKMRVPIQGVEESLIDEILNGFVESYALARGPEPTLYFVKKPGIMQVVQARCEVRFGMVCRISHNGFEGVVTCINDDGTVDISVLDSTKIMVFRKMLPTKLIFEGPFRMP